MFLYKDNRFHFNNISFCLPDNVYLNAGGEEYDGCMELRPNGADFCIIIFSDYKENGAEQFFSKGEAEECYRWVSDITPFTVNNLSGYFCSYKSNYNVYSEYRFDIDNKNDANVLGIRIHGKTPIDMEQTLKHPAVVNLLQSLNKISG